MLGAADFDKDDTVTLPEIELYAKRRVPDYVRDQFGGQRQMPNLKGNTRGLLLWSVWPILHAKTKIVCGSTKLGVGARNRKLGWHEVRSRCGGHRVDGKGIHEARTEL